MDSSTRNEAGGMVAVITGLKGAGLTVTVGDARQLDSRNRISPAHVMSQGQMRTSTSGVQTGRGPERSLSNTQFERTPYQPVYDAPMASSPTWPMRDVPTSDANELQQLEEQFNELRASWLANDRAASTASCPRALTSPVRSPSAPIRRPSPPDMPSRQLGMVPVRDVARRSSVNLNRGPTATSTSLPSYRRHNASDTFAESLRKYPNPNLAVRTISADIIQRLLAQTQHKNGSKRTARAKRVRSLTRHTHDPCCVKRSSNKVIQTTRRSESSSAEVIAAICGTERQKRVLNLEGRDGRRVSYECLTKSFTHAHRSTDVRYLSDVTRYVRDTLRQIGNNEDRVCPYMQHRYSAHRREFHRTEASTVTNRDSNLHASSSKRPKTSCRFADLDHAADCRGQTSNWCNSIRKKMIDMQEKLCQICNQPTPCRCELEPPCPCPENRPTTLKNRLKSLDFCEELRRLYTQDPIYEACICPQEVDEIIDDAVDKWLKNIPIYAGYTYKERLTRDAVVDELKTNLKQHVGEKLKCRTDIFTCLGNLPMWLPKTDNDIFKERLGDDLLMMIESIDLFGCKVKRWVETLPFLPNIAVNKDKIATDLSRKLKDIAMTTKDFRNDLTQGTYEELDNLPIRVCSCVEKEDLAERLTDSLIRLPQEVIDNLINMDDFSRVRKKAGLQEKVKKWIYAVPIDTTEVVDRGEVASDLTEKLYTLVDNTEPDKLWKTVKKTARLRLEGINVQGGRTETEIQASKLADILTTYFFGAIVDKWTKGLAFDHNSNVVPDIFAYDLTKKLMTCLDTVDPDEIEEHMKHIINDMLNSTPASGSMSLKLTQAAKLAQALSKLGSSKTGAVNDIIKQWVELIPFESESAADKRKIVNNLTKNVKRTIETKLADEIWFEVKQDAFTEIKNIPVTCHANKLERLAENLADQLVKLMFDEAVDNWIKGLPFKAGSELNADKFLKNFKDKFQDGALLEYPHNATKFIKEQLSDPLTDELLECDEENKTKLVNGFMDTVINVPKPRDKVTMIIENWLKYKVPLTTSISTDKIKSIVKKFKSKLTSTSPPEQWIAMKVVALEVLEHLPIDCLPTELEVLAEKLASKLASDVFTDIVKEWAKNIELDPYSDELVEEFTTKLTKKLKKVIGTGEIEEARDAIKPIIVQELGEVTLCDIGKKEEEAEKLLSALESIHKDRDHILTQVELWFRTVPFMPEPPVNKIKITRKLAENIRNKLEPIKSNNAWHELKLVTQVELEGLPVTGGHPTIEKLAEDLANLLISGMFFDTIKNWSKKVPFDPKKEINKTEIIHDLAKKVKNIVDTTDPDSLQRSLSETLKDAVIDILDNLPVICTKSQKTSLAEELANEISDIPKEQDKFSQTLYDRVQMFPFDPKDGVDKDKLAEEMEHKLKKVVDIEPPEKARDIMKNEISDSLKKYKTKIDQTELEKFEDDLADQLVLDIFTDTIRRWVNRVRFNPTPPVDNSEVSQTLTDELRPKFTPSKPDKDDIIHTIRRKLEKLPVDCNSITKDSYLTQMAKDLYDKLILCPPEETEERKRKRHPPPTFAINVNQMIKGVTVTLDADQNEKIVKDTLDKLRTLRLEGKDEATIKKILRRDIEVGVDEMLEGKKTDPQARKNLAKKLYTQVLDTFKVIGGERKQELLPKFINSINDWLAAHVEISLPKSKKESFVQDLAEKIATAAVSVGAQTDIKQKIMTIIGNTLDTVNSTFKNDSNLKNTLRESLTQRIIADMEIIPPEAGKKDRKENNKHVKDIKKRENETQAEDMKSKKETRHVVISFSDFCGNKLQKNERDQKLTVKDKSALVGDLLQTLEKSVDISEDVYETRTGPPDDVINNTRKWNESIPEIPASELLSQIPNEFPNIDKENKKIENLPIDIKTKRIFTNKMTEHLSSNHSSLSKSIMPNTSTRIKRYKEERSIYPIISGESMTEIKTNETRSQNLTNKLRSHQSHCLDSKQPEIEMVSIIENKLESTSSIDAVKKNKLADKLLVKLLRTIGTVSLKPTKEIENFKRSLSDIISEENLEDAIRKDVKEWLNEITEISSKSSTKEMSCQQNVKGFTVNIAEFKEKQDVQEKSNSTDSSDSRDNGINTRPKNKLLGTIIDSSVLTVSTASYFSTSSDDDQQNNLETIKKDVTAWMEGVLEWSSGKHVEVKDIEKIILALTKKLTKVNMQDLGKNEFRNKLRQEIIDKLNEHLKCNGEQMCTETKQILVNQLIGKVTKSVKALSSTQKYSVTIDAQNKPLNSSRDIKYRIKKWIDHISEFSYCNQAKKKQIKRLTRALAKKISRISEQGLDEEEARQKMIDTINDKLNIAFKIIDQQIDSKRKQKLTNELLGNLSESVSPDSSSFYAAYKNKQELRKNIKTNVEEWMEGIFGTSAKTLESRKLARKIIKNVIKILTNCQPVCNKEVKNYIVLKIKEELENVYNYKSISISTTVKNELTDKLLKKLIKTAETFPVDFSRVLKNSNRASIDENFNKWKNGVADFATKMATETEGFGNEKLTRKNVSPIVSLHLKMSDLEEKHAYDLEAAFKKDVANWIEEFTEFKGNTTVDKRENEKITIDLSKALTLLQVKGKDNLTIHKQMQKEIKKQIGKTFYYRGKDLDKNTKNELVNELLRKIINTINRIESFRTTTNSTKAIQPDISKMTGTIKTKTESLNLDVLTRQIFDDYLTTWFEDIPKLQAISTTERKMQNKILLDLAKNLASLQFQNLDESDLRNRMAIEVKSKLDFISRNKSVCLNSKTKDDLIYQLIDHLTETNENHNELTTSYIKKVTSTSNTVSKMYDRNVFSCLDNPNSNANKTKEKNKRNSTLQLESKEHLGVLEKKKQLYPKKLNRLANKWTNTITSFSNAAHNNKDFQDSIIWEWVHDISLPSHNLLAEREKVKKIYVEDNIKNQSVKKAWTDKTSKEKAAKVNECLKFRLAKDLETSSNHLRPRNDNFYNKIPLSPLVNNESAKRSISHFTSRLSKVFYLEKSSSSNVKEISKELDPDTQAKIFEIILNNMDAIEEPEEREIVKKQIVQVLMHDAELPEDEAIDLSESILKSVEQQVASVGTTEENLLEILRNEIRKIMSEYPIDINNRDYIEKLLMDLEQRRLFEGQSYDDDDDTKEKILKLIKEKGGLSDEDAVALLGKMGGNYENLLLSRVPKSILKLNSITTNNSNTSVDVLDFKNRAEDILTDFFDTYVDYPSPEKQKKIDAVTAETVSNLGNIVQNPDNDNTAHIEPMRAELNKQIRRVSLDTAESITDLVEDVLEELQDAYRRAKSSKNATVNRYTNEIEKVIEDWLDGLPIKSDNLNDEQFRDTMIKDLVGGIIDREEYLQLHTDIKTSEANERDNLKNKCHIWMKKFLEGDDLEVAMFGTDELINALRGIPVPKLTAEQPTYFDALQDEILGWAKRLPPHIKPTVNDEIMKKHVNDLAKTIQNVKGKPDAEEKIRSAIDRTLPSIYEDLDEAELKRLNSSLFNTLMNKGFTDDTWVPEVSTGDKPTYLGALQNEILGWAKRLPPNIKPTVNDKTMKKHVNDLAKTIQNVKGKPDAEEKIRSAIGQTLPSIYGDQDQDELKRLNSSLFNTLMNKGFTDDTWVPEVSTGDKPTYLGALQNEILGWAKRLPPNIKPTVNDEAMKKHVNDLAKSIQSLKGKPDAEEKIRSAIGQTLPSIYGDQDQDELKRLNSSLFNTLMNKGFTDDTWVPEVSTGDKPTYLGALQNEILGWAKRLPPNIKPTVNDEAMKKHVNDLAKSIQSLKGKPDAEEKIRSAIGQTLPSIYGDLDEAELKRLNSSLFSTLMNKGFTDDTWVPEVSTGDKPTYLGALQKEILEWAKRLPPNIKPTVNDEAMKKHVNDLAKTIQSLKGKPDAEEKIRSAIGQTLPSIYGDLDEAELKRLNSSLFGTLMNKGFTDDTWVPEVSTGDKPTYLGALQKEILGWAKRLPPNIKPTVNDEAMKKHVNDLAKTIQSLKGKPDAEEKIRSAIGQTLPSIYGDLDEAELKRLNSSLFGTLMNKGFTDDTWVPEVSTGDKPTYLGALQKEILGWAKRLPPNIKPTVNDEAMKKHVNDLAKTIQSLKGKPDAEEKIRSAIGQTLPSIYGDLDEAELKRLNSSLFSTLMNKGFTDDTWVPEVSTGDKPTYLGALQKEILEWAKRLPPNIKPTVNDEAMKKHVNDLAKTIQSLKGKPDAEEKIRSAIGQTLPSIYGDLDEAELKRLNSSLFGTLMNKGFTDDTWVPEVSTGDKPTYLGALQKEILGWAKRLPPNIKPTVNDEAMKKHVNDLAKTIQSLKGKPDAEEKIRSAIGQTLPSIYGDLDEAELKRLNSSLFSTLMNKGFTDDTWVPHETSELDEDNLLSEVLSWLNESPMYQNASPEEKKQMELAAIEMAKGLNKNILNLPPTSGDTEKMLHKELKNHLKHVILDPECKNNEMFLNITGDNTLNYMKTKPTFQELTGLVGSDDFFQLAVDNWVNTLPIDVKSPVEQERLNEAKINLASRLKQARNQFPPSMPEHEQAIRDEARKFLRSNLSDPRKRSDERYIDDMANTLVKLMNMVPIAFSDTISSIKPYKSPADTLYDYIGEWVTNLPVQGDVEKVNLIKQNLASKLINKIGELNMNPDIFNDTDLYQYSLGDEIDKLLQEVPRNPELDKYLPALKKELVFKIMDARQKILDELAGKVYKQHLRDTISTSLPLPGCLPVDEQASFELIKDKLADAFIDLHFTECGENELKNFKKKISNELDRFCSDIFRHYPCARIDVDKVKVDLHSALMKVPTPRDDSMKSEVEQVRIRDIVNDWMRELPVRQETSSDKLRRYKLAVVLAKHIHDIEMEKQRNDFIDSEYRIREEIKKFMNMIPLREDRECLIPHLTQVLINTLEHSEQSRRFFSSSRCQTCQTQEYTSLCSQHNMLSSTLCSTRNKEKQNQTCKDALVCTPLIDSCSQTCHEVQQVTSQKSCTATPLKRDASCMTPKGNQCNFSPKILVKEYIWDSPEAVPPCLQRSFSQGVQARSPQFMPERNFAPTSSAVEQQTSPYEAYPPTPVSQHPSTYGSDAVNPPLPQEAQNDTYSSYAGLPRPQINQSPLQLPIMNDRPTNSQCYCPPFQEREIPCKKTRSYSTEEEEEWPCAGPSRFFRRPYLDSGEVKKMYGRPPGLKRSLGFDDEDFWNACWRHRGRPMAGYRSDKIKDKCNCKERVWVSCKGLRNRFIDMCQACGSTCPHPQEFLFK